MPELPEVEVTMRGVRPFLEKQRIKSVYFDEYKLREPFDPRLKTLEGATIDEVSRRGKYIIVHSTQGSIIVHLGMTGNFKVCNADAPAQKHDHFALTLESGKMVRMNDSRRFGLVRYVQPGDDPLMDKHLRDLGPEPLTPAFNGTYLHQRLQRIKRGEIKPALMNSKVVVGVGNIYASESLFSAKIHPQSIACALSLGQCEELCAVIKATLKRSIAEGGTTIRDFEGADGKPGYFVQELQVYGKDGQPCPRCGHTIEKIVQGQRSTYFCPHCQQRATC